MSSLDKLAVDLSKSRASRRRFLGTAAAAGLAVPMMGGLGRLSAVAQDEARNSVVWVSPRGTLEVLDDYPYWVAKQFGYFGDIETEILPAILESTSSAKNVVDGDADMSYVSPGVFADAVSQGLDLVSVFQMGAYDVFDIALPKGNPDGITTPADLEGKTVVLGDIGWAAIVDPMIVQAGGDPSQVNYVAAGSGWAQTLEAGQADAALSWEGLRAQWLATGLDFDYILGYEWSVFPANSFQIRRGDFEDASLTELYTNYLKGWAMGLEFGYQNPVAATQITMEEPSISAALTDTFQDLNVAVESLWQLANVYRGDWDSREGWGWASIEGWQSFFDASAQAMGADPIDASTVVFNDYVAGANEFDQEQVIADASGFELSEAFAAVAAPEGAGLAAS
ncbi:MAG: ABC transporter substrate-binding protein [Thermomicrobiales bacterium]|nr:ABC transporter substrate-binding protein [Thermomicrobiales bacterium]